MSSSSEQESFERKKVRVLYAPWEKRFDNVLSPFERFVKHQATAGLLLMFTALLALIVANSHWGEAYRHLLHVDLGIIIGEWNFTKTAHHWINDGLMAAFFFVVGLELKREILVGELSDIRLATLPIIAAIGGMLVPALLYFAINPEGPEAQGWGIPMATDIAFALGVIALLAGRVPKSLISFLVALAIVDDLGAIIIIAVFYTSEIVWPALIAAAAITVIMSMMNLVGIRRPTPYFIVGFFLWVALMKSGVHATLAGVISAFAIPALPRFDPLSFSDRVRDLLNQFESNHKAGQSILKNQKMLTTVHALNQGVKGVEAPLQRLERRLHSPVAFIILPVFAFFNAGILIDFSNIGGMLNQPVVLGVAAGLIAGKVIGVAGFSWLALKMGVASLPPNVRMTHIFGASMLASIGFTMSIFIAELAFKSQPELIMQAKVGILLASVLAGICGYLWLRALGSNQQTNQAE